MVEKISKEHVERAGEILAELAKKNLSGLRSVDDAVKDFNISKDDLRKIESRFDAGRLEILYHLFKSKFFHLQEFPFEIEKKIMLMKNFAGEQNEKALDRAKGLYIDIYNQLKSFDARLSQRNKNYKSKFN